MMELHKISRRSFLEATALSGAAAVFSHPLSCKSSKDHSKPRNEVDTSLKSPV